VPGLGLACITAQEAFAAYADLAIECMPAPVLERICRPMLGAEKRVTVLSAAWYCRRPI
jgi:aspartate dehydrogenase